MELYRALNRESKTLEAEWQHNLHAALLRGHVPLSDIPRVRPTCVKVYLSSVYTESSCERFYLTHQVYPKLREYCRAAHGIEFQVVDLRSGVARDCSEVLPSIQKYASYEVAECKKHSVGPFFVAFQGQRYGSEAIPPMTIPLVDFDTRVQALEKNNHDVSLIRKCYKLDENAHPSVYLLQPLLIDCKKWIQVERKIVDLFTAASKYVNSGDWVNPVADVRIELDQGLFHVTSQKTKDDNCLVLKREITDLAERLDRKAASKFIDMVPGTNEMNFEANKALKDVFAGIQNSVTKNNVFHFEVKWSEPNGVDLKDHEKYLTDFGNTFFEHVRRHIDVNMIEWDQYPEDELYTEVQQHWLETRRNVSTFYEQSHLLAQINAYIVSQTCQPIIVHGVSGSGKSALLSKVAAMASEKTSILRVILRHLGKTPSSSEVRQLLQNLIKQICHAINYDMPEKKLMKSYLDIKQTFKHILETGGCNNTLLIIIDGLDNLQTVGYEQIDWLPQKLSPNFKMIISTRDDDSKHTLEKLRSRYTDEGLFIEVENMIPEVCEWILKRRLSEVGRTVTHDQWKKIVHCINEYPYPLYTELVYQTVVRWSSFTYPYLPDSIGALCERILESCEQNCGEIVTRHILSIITCSKYGLTEAEINDILSIDDEVLNLFPSAMTSAYRRAPCLIWSRVKYYLDPFLTYWKVDGFNLITWKYTQMAETVTQRYFQNDDFCKQIHSLVADFFIGKWSGRKAKPNNGLQAESKSSLLVIEPSSKSSHRLVISQPLVVSGHGTTSRLNVRKLNELPYHLAKAGRFEDIGKLMFFNYEWLHTKLAALNMSRVLADFDLVSAPEVNLVGQALKEIEEIFHPDILGIELTGRLIPYYDNDHPNIRSLIAQCDTKAMTTCSMIPSVQLFTTPGAPLEKVFPPISSTVKLQIISVEKYDNPSVLLKCPAWNYAIRRNLLSHDNTLISTMPPGPVNITPNFEVAIAMKGGSVEAYQLDSHQKLCSIEVQKGKMACDFLSNQYYAFALEKKTGPFIVDFKYPSLLHRFNHRPTAIAINDTSDVLVHNDGHVIHFYELPLMNRRCSIATDDNLKKILFCKNPTSYYTHSSSHHIRLYTVNRVNKTSKVTTIFQQPTIQEILLSNQKDLLMMRLQKSVLVFDTTHHKVSVRIQCISTDTAELSHDFVAAQFIENGSKFITVRAQNLGIFSSVSGTLLRLLQVPYPSDIIAAASWDSSNKLFTVLQNGMSQIWNMEYVLSQKKHRNNFYPGEISSFSVSDDGLRLAVCNNADSIPKVINGYTSEVVQELCDNFTAGAKPLEVYISPKGSHVISRCSNEPEGSIDWEVLRGDYVWNVSANRVTHFFLNNHSIVFSDDDELIAAISCIGYSSVDYSNKLFVALCYTLSGKIQEHRTVFPDGDLVGEPVLYSKRKELVCLIQPCVKTKFDGLVMEQRVDEILLYIFDIFTSSATERRSVSCSSLIPNLNNAFFLDIRKTDRQYELLLIYAQGKLPPYKANGMLDRSYYTSKGMLVYDLQEGTILKHIPSYLEPSTSVEYMLISSYLSTILHNWNFFNGKTGQYSHKLKLSVRASEDIAPVLLLDGHYVAFVTSDRQKVVLFNSETSRERGHCLIHGEANDLQVGKDDRTLYISTSDGRILSLTVILELCDPITMVINKMPSRQYPAQLTEPKCDY